MTKAVEELVDYMEDMGTEVMNTSNLGLEFEGMNLDYVVLSEHWQTKKKSISFVNGRPEDKHSIWLNSEDAKDYAGEFDHLCEQIIALN